MQTAFKTRHEMVCGLTSLSAEQAPPLQLLQMLRSYWPIENSLHYPRDVTLHEDQTRFKNHSAAYTMAMINNLIIALTAQSNPHLLGWTMENFPSIELKGDNLTCWQNGELTNVDDQAAL